MDTTPADSPTAHRAPRKNAARARSAAERPRVPHATKAAPPAPARKGRPRAALPTSAAEVQEEIVAAIQDFSGERARELIKADPLAAVFGALATGYILGGGWRTRFGRFILLSAGRAALVEAASRYLSQH